MTGTVFDIQRFSVHDGPGIRTTVFMKGCPLRCRWCHNPEGLSSAPQLQFFKEACIGCGRCGERKALSDAQACPAQALKVCGQQIGEDEVINTVLRDMIYYGESGGITFSGGECLLQADFVSSVLQRAKEKGLHTAVDTSGAVPWSAFEKVDPFTDLYLYDVKCIDGDLHKAFTGMGNQGILENLARLLALGRKLWIRVPVIPGFNGSREEMEAIAVHIAALPKAEQITLMPYHTLGASKYETLGYDYPFDTKLSVTAQELSEYETIFRDHGLHLA